MIRHLIASGYALTRCGMTAAVPGSLVTELADVNCPDCRKALVRQGVCPACGEQMMSWSAYPRNKTGVADGRLRMNDVETAFYLACEYCSETLIARVDPEQVAAALTAANWRP